MVLYIEEKQVSNQEHVVDISSVVKSKKNLLSKLKSFERERGRGQQWKLTANKVRM